MTTLIDIGAAAPTAGRPAGPRGHGAAARAGDSSTSAPPTGAPASTPASPATTPFADLMVGVVGSLSHGHRGGGDDATGTGSGRSARRDHDHRGDDRNAPDTASLAVVITAPPAVPSTDQAGAATRTGGGPASRRAIDVHEIPPVVRHLTESGESRRTTYPGTTPPGASGGATARAATRSTEPAPIPGHRPRADGDAAPAMTRRVGQPRNDSAIARPADPTSPVGAGPASRSETPTAVDNPDRPSARSQDAAHRPPTAARAPSPHPTVAEATATGSPFTSHRVDDRTQHNGTRFPGPASAAGTTTVAGLGDGASALTGSPIPSGPTVATPSSQHAAVPTPPGAPAQSALPQPALPQSALPQSALPQPALLQPALSGALLRLRDSADGSYQLRVSVHPADLGVVDVVATISHGSLAVTLSCPDHAARSAVADALPQLRQQLTDTGFTGVDVGLGAPQQEQRQPAPTGHREAPDAPAGRTRAEALATPTTATRRANPRAALDRWL